MCRNGVANLVPSDLRKFFKRLRINLKRANRDDKISYYACGEYGDKTDRPHYHAIIFGFPYTDPGFLRDTWSHGHTHVGTVTADSVRYVAQYIDKKLLGTASYFSDRENSFQVASQGIGVDWIRGELERVLYDASCQLRGKRYPLSRRYREELHKLFPEAAEGVDMRIREQALKLQADLILDLAPEFGGRNYNQLSDLEKREVRDRIYNRGKVVEDDLKAGLIFKQNQKINRRKI